MQHLFFQTELTASGTYSTMNGRLRPPIAVLCGSDFALYSSFLRHGLQYGGYTLLTPLFPALAHRDSLYLHTNAGAYPLLVQAAQPRWTLVLVLTVKHHAFGLLLPLRLWVRLSRRRGGVACSHFFPRSVGLGPTDSLANGAFVMQPSMLSQVQLMPCNSS